MVQTIEIRPRRDVAREKWDAFVEANDEAWFWHRGDLIEALALWHDHQDASFAVVDRRGALLALMPLHRKVVRVARVVPIVHFTSLGGPACAKALSSSERAKVLSVLRDHLLGLILKHNALALEVQVAPLTPSLNGASAPKYNPLILAGLANTQTETWMVDLTGTPDEIRKRYSESTRQELRKATKADIQLREAAGTKDLDIYYKLHLETYHRTGARPHPFDYFQAIFEKFQPAGLARILFAERQGKVVAAQNTGLYKAGAFYWTGASISEKEGGENRLLLDAQIMAARAGGFTRYETGQAFVNTTDAKERGLSHFKRSFGASLHPYYRGVLNSARLSSRIIWGLRAMYRTLRTMP